MQHFNSFYALNIFSLTLDKWEYPLHKHNFFELIFIEEGKGKHILNEITFAYEQGDIFLLTASDAHEFIIERKTTFTYIKFTEQLFLEKLEGGKDTKWATIVKGIIEKQQHVAKSIINNETDQKHLFSLLKIIQYEYTNTTSYHRETVLEIFGAIMIIAARNINQAKNIYIPGNINEKTTDILAYIRLNVYNNEKVSIKAMADYFSMSTNYISTYIKKNTGISIQQYIMQCKIKAAEQLLKQSDYNINEIANKLGFTDASHFNKIFKKYRNVTPSKWNSI